MHNRTTSRRCLSLLFLLVFAWQGCCRNERDKRDAGATTPPNVIWILEDACRADRLSSYGNPRPTTPNLDRLASRGVLFERNFAQSTQTTLSLPSYLTGRYYPVAYIGMYGVTEQNIFLALPPEEEVILPEIFRNNGYDTVLISGANPYLSVHQRLPKAFDERHLVRPSRPGPAAHAGRPFANLQRPLASFQEHLPSIRKYLRTPRDRPFFMYIHATDTHFPHILEPPGDRWIDPDYDTNLIVQSRNGAMTGRIDSQPYDAEDQSYLKALHDGSLHTADRFIGILLDDLERLGLSSNTIVIFGSDHGDALGEDGRTIGHGDRKTWDEVTQVPLIMAGPGLPKGRRVSAITENVAIVPTLIELLGLDTPAAPDAQSLLPLATGVASDMPRYAFTKSYETPRLSLRSDRFRYEVDLETGEQFLFAAPDRVATRRDVISSHPEAAALHRRVIDQILEGPARLASTNPYLAIFLDTQHLLPEHKASSAQIVVPSRRFGNPKWFLEGQHWLAAPSSENVPPLKLHTEVRNDDYRVYVEMLSRAKFRGKPASSIQLRLEDEPSFRTLTTALEANAFVLVDAGTASVRDGFIDAEIRPGSAPYWSSIRSIILVPRNDRAEAAFAKLFDRVTYSQGELDDMAKKLRALGYIE